jgi:GNAT superfamily N-acetyltransferase
MKYHAPALTAFKSGSNMCPCNRAIISHDTELPELQKLHDFYAGMKYALWTEESDSQAKNKAMLHGFSYAGSFAAMKLDMEKLKITPLDSQVVIRPVANDEELFAVWIPTMVQSYATDLAEDTQKNYAEQFEVFVRYLRQAHACPDLVFYLGLWDNIPVATSMFVCSQGIVGIHRIGTLQAFRRRGIGTAITTFPLQEFKKQGINQALLLASSTGYSLYEKIGFEKLLTYAVYTKK